MMIWQLLQVRHLQKTPLILVGKMWPGLIEWAKTSMLSTDPPLANPGDMTIPVCVASAEKRRGWTEAGQMCRDVYAEALWMNV